MRNRGVTAAIIDDVAAVERGILDGEAPGPVADAVAGLFPREIEITVNIRKGDRMESVTGRSVVMDRAERVKADQIEAAQRGGFPAGSFTDGQNARFRAWGLVRVQLRLDKADEWAYDALYNDGDTLVQVGGALAIHEQRWFRGYSATNARVPQLPAVVAPALDDADGAGTALPDSGGC